MWVKQKQIWFRSRKLFFSPLSAHILLASLADCVPAWRPRPVWCSGAILPAAAASFSPLKALWFLRRPLYFLRLPSNYHQGQHSTVAEAKALSVPPTSSISAFWSLIQQAVFFFVLFFLGAFFVASITASGETNTRKAFIRSKPYVKGFLKFIILFIKRRRHR